MTQLTALFSSANLTAPRTSVVRADGVSVEAVALPVLPPAPFRTFADDARHDTEYVYDAAQLIAHFDPARPLALDVEHATETGAPDTRSRGWCHRLLTAADAPELSLAEDVLYGLFELNALGTAELSDRRYGYTSAVALGEFDSEGGYRISSLKSLALTNNPATKMPTAFSRAPKSGAKNASYTSHSNSSTHAMFEQLVQILGLDGADEAAVLEAVSALVTAVAATAAAAEAAAAAAPAAEAPAASDEALTALTARVDALASSVETLTSQRAAFSASLSKQITPTKLPTAAEKAGVSPAAFAKAQATLAARGRAI